MVNIEPMKVFPPKNEPLPEEREVNKQRTPEKLVLRDMGIQRPWKDELVEKVNELIDLVLAQRQEYADFLVAVRELIENAPMPQIITNSETSADE